MKSMTGYGKATILRDNRELTVELKSVNHRFLDISTKIPRAFIEFEDVIRNTLSESVSRGHVDVFINYRLVGDTDREVSVDTALASSYIDAAKQLQQDFPDLHYDFNITALMRSGDVLAIVQKDEDADTIRIMLGEAVAAAAEKLNEMRLREGEALKSDLSGKIDNVQALLDRVEEYAPQVATQYRDKLRQRITEALAGIQIDEAKLANEVCFFVDKSCIDEEITRLRGHISHAREIMALSEPAGRKLDFLVQEFNREANTICSKSNFAELTGVVLEMKNEIEKIREQVQNIE